MKLTVYEAASFMGVELSITVDGLKAKYKELARRYHPDISTLHDAMELMQKLNVSFELLIDKVPMLGTRPGFTSGTTGIKSDYEDAMQYSFGKFSNHNDFFDAFFKQAFERATQKDDVKAQFGGGRNAGKTAQQQSDAQFAKSKDYDWKDLGGFTRQKRKNPNMVTTLYLNRKIQLTHTIGIDTYPVSVALPNLFDTVEAAMDYADQCIFYDKAPPKAPKTQWKRANSGNMWKEVNGVAVIIFPDKKNKGLYKAMSVKNGEKTYYQDMFTSEEKGMIYADRFIFTS